MIIPEIRMVKKEKKLVEFFVLNWHLLELKDRKLKSRNVYIFANSAFVIAFGTFEFC
jgi:hypothetical protein